MNALAIDNNAEHSKEVNKVLRWCGTVPHLGGNGRQEVFDHQETSQRKCTDVRPPFGMNPNIDGLVL